MVALVALSIGGWSVRNTIQHADGDARAGINFVQGSWPEYHDVWKWPWRWPEKDKAINAEVATIQQDRTAGVSAVLARMSVEPGRYAAWYASKPYLLWAWDVRIGHGTVYTVKMTDTPLDRGVLLGTTVIQYTLNSLAFALALGGLLLAWRGPTPLRMVAVAVLYLTAVHVVLQAEPRYAIPYRSLEIMLALGAMSYLYGRVKVRVSPAAQPVEPVTVHSVSQAVPLVLD
jgi:hypothetical protein